MNIAELMETATGYWRSAALSAALKLGLFEALARPGPRTAETLAKELDCAPRHTAGLLDALAGMGVLDKTPEGYRVSEGLRMALDPNHPASLLDALRYNTDLYAVWGSLDQCIRDGRPVLPPDTHLGADPERTERFVRGMHSRGRALAPLVVPALDFGGCRRLLDVASGPGSFSVPLAEREPGLSLTLFDLAPVLETARGLLARSSAWPRLQFLAGDYHRDPLPEDFDGLLYSGALHQESEAEARALFAQFARALRPGGVLVVVDLLLDADRCHPVFSALFSLNMMLTRPEGGVHAAEMAQRLLAGAGFAELETRDIPRTPYRLIRARRSPAAPPSLSGR